MASFSRLPLFCPAHRLRRLLAPATELNLEAWRRYLAARRAAFRGGKRFFATVVVKIP
jgi:hypothetical protein